MSSSQIVNLVVAIFFAVPFIICGKKWSKGKWLDFMAGYNSTPEKEKKNVNIDKLKKYSPIIMYTVAIGIVFLGSLNFYIDKLPKSCHTILPLVVVLIMIFIVIYCIHNIRNSISTKLK